MKYSFFYMIVSLALIAGCVPQDQFSTLDRRVAALEKNIINSQGDESENKDKLAQIEKRFQHDINSTREDYAEIKYEIGRIKEDIQRLEGVIEETNQKMLNFTQTEGEDLEKTLERLDNAISKNYTKIIKLEKYMGFEPSVIKPVDENQDKPVQDTYDKSETQLYSLAKKLLDDGDRENARIQFENFINRYPKSVNADNARFWIADSYYSDKWYEKAILEYQKVLEEYPDSNKTAAALLKQGYSFAELGEKANARLLLKELIKKHPKTNEAKYAKEKLKKLQ